MKPFILNDMNRLRGRRGQVRLQNRLNLYNLLNILIFCCLLAMEMLSLREQILLNVHRGESCGPGAH